MKSEQFAEIFPKKTEITLDKMPKDFVSFRLENVLGRRKNAKREFIVKFVKGSAILLVLCLAAYGAFTLLKKSPQIDVSDTDIAYLEEIGISIADGQAADSGLSAILGGIEGAPPIGSSSGIPATATGSSVPPSFLGGTASTAPPAFLSAAMDTAPTFAPAYTEPQQAAEFQPSELLPPTFAPAFDAVPLPDSASPETSEPVQFLDQAPAFDASPLEAPPVDGLAPAFEASFFDGLPPPEMLASVGESPPPWKESWDGPASGIASIPPPTPPPAKPLPSFSSAPKITSLPSTGTTYNARYNSGPNTAAQTSWDGVRRIEPNQTEHNQNRQPQSQSLAFSSSESIPVESAPAKYTQTSIRQTLTFEPVKPEASSSGPVVVFGTPKSPNSTPTNQASPNQASATPSPQVEQPPVLATSPLLATTVLQQVQALPPSATPPISPQVQGFIQSQRQLAESGDAEQVRQAFIQLSQLFEFNELGDAERAMVQPILDVLALRVIYAGDAHILEDPYRVKPGETVESIARDFNLTSALLRKINGIAVNQEVLPGTTLKVLHGQFDARISVHRKELTLLLGGLYAGRFAFAMPNSGAVPQSGELFVTHKADRMIRLSNGWTLGTAYASDATIVFTDKDAREIFDILSEQSVLVLE